MFTRPLPFAASNSAAFAWHGIMWRFRGLYLIRLNPPGFECLSSSPIAASAVEKGPKQSACSFQSQASFGEVVCSRMQYHWPGSISAMWHSRWQLMISSAPAVSPPTLFPIRGLLDPGGQLRLVLLQPGHRLFGVDVAFEADLLHPVRDLHVLEQLGQLLVPAGHELSRWEEHTSELQSPCNLVC